MLQNLAIAVNYPQTLTVRPFTEDGTYLKHRTRRNQADTPLEASFLLASFHSSKRYYACYQKRKVGINTIQLQTLWTTIITGLSLCNSGTNTIGVNYEFLVEFNVSSIR